MENFMFLIFIFMVIMALVLMTFAVFAIGFLFGYKSEDKKLSKRKEPNENSTTQESDKEKRAKKDWKNFLEYDGSAPDGRVWTKNINSW